MEALTDNRNRIVAELRYILGKAGGNLGENGCVGWMFDKRGQIIVERSKVEDVDELQMMAIEAGADDIDDSDDEALTIFTSPEKFESVRDALAELAEETAFAEISYIPQNTVALDAQSAKAVVRMVGLLEDLDDVQEVNHNAELDDAAFEGE